LLLLLLPSLVGRINWRCGSDGDKEIADRTPDNWILLDLPGFLSSTGFNHRRDRMGHQRDARIRRVAYGYVFAHPSVAYLSYYPGVDSIPASRFPRLESGFENYWEHNYSFGVGSSGRIGCNVGHI